MITFKRILLSLLGIPCLIFIFVTIALLIVHKTKGVPFDYENNGTDLSFMSSDGEWSDQEDMINGYNFEKVLLSFELYRIQCGQSDATLYRTKAKKKPYKWAWWFDDHSSPKWSVPYKEVGQITVASGSPCKPGAPSNDELRKAQTRVEARLKKLQADS